MPRLPSPIHFIIYSRAYCHLCDDMRDALHLLLQERPCEIEMIDVDADPLLLEKYDELVPLLMGKTRAGKLVRLCHYFLDATAVSAFTEEER
ncbi:glutaredoxin family protein [Herbaspirillum lusitanum]|uniref:Glutaredoxin family protein n=1 Tax=Herbaspirillum lusitanum TaxID=213312 RepID=A0ABW9A4G1_9BURK